MNDEKQPKPDTNDHTNAARTPPREKTLGKQVTAPPAKARPDKSAR
jgi:hypothetical protein